MLFRFNGSVWIREYLLYGVFLAFLYIVMASSASDCHARNQTTFDHYRSMCCEDLSCTSIFAALVDVLTELWLVGGMFSRPDLTSLEHMMVERLYRDSYTTYLNINHQVGDHAVLLVVIK